MSSENGVNGSTLFGGNRPLFGSSSSNSQPPFSTTPNSTLPDVSKLSISSSTTHIPPLPAYQPAQYLTTTEEYLLPPQDIETVGDDDDEETLDQKEEFRDARWEQLLPQHVDVIFERFVRRLEDADGGAQQVLRYVPYLEMEFRADRYQT